MNIQFARIIDRQLFRELALNLLGSVAVVAVVFYIGGLSTQFDRRAFEGLAMSTVLRHMGLMMLTTSFLLVPLTVMATCLFTYGRFAADGEFDATRTSGIPPFKTLMPALAIGALAMGALAVLQDTIIPDARYAGRKITVDGFEQVTNIFLRNDRKLALRGFIFTWSAAHQDSNGDLVLDNVLLIQYNKQTGLPSATTSAARARPSVDPDSDILTLELEDLRREESNSVVQRFARLTQVVDLDSLWNRKLVPRAPADLSYASLLAEMGRGAGQLRAAEVSAEWWFRVTAAIAAFLAAAIGAPVGVLLRLRNRAITFIVGLGIIALIFFPLLATSKLLAEKGTVSASTAMAIPIGALLIIATALYRKAARG